MAIHKALELPSRTVHPQIIPKSVSRMQSTLLGVLRGAPNTGNSCIQIRPSYFHLEMEKELHKISKGFLHRE